MWFCVTANAQNLGVIYRVHVYCTGASIHEITPRFWAFAVTQNHIRRSTRPFLSLPQHKRKKGGLGTRLVCVCVCVYVCVCRSILMALHSRPYNHQPFTSFMLWAQLIYTNQQAIGLLPEATQEKPHNLSTTITTVLSYDYHSPPKCKKKSGLATRD